MILETLLGKVNWEEDGKFFVSFESKTTGKNFTSLVSTDVLIKSGIGVGDYFKGEIIKGEKSTELIYTKVEPKKVDLQKIMEEAKQKYNI